MITQRKAMPNRMTTSVESQFDSCTKLAYRTETLAHTHQKSLKGGMANNLNPDHDNTLEGGYVGAGGGGGGGALIALAVISAAGAWKEEIYDGIDSATAAVDQFVDTYSRAWDKLWD